MKIRLNPIELRVETFAIEQYIAPVNPDDSYTGFYGNGCVSLPPNCLQTARKC